MRTNKKVLGTTLLACVVTLSAHGFNGGWGYLPSDDQPHIGVKFGQAKHTPDPAFLSELGVLDNQNLEIEDADIYGAYTGYTFASGIGFEADYIETGKAKVDLTKAESDGIASVVRGDIKTKSLGLAATYKHDLSDTGKFYLKGKIGGTVNDTELAIGNEALNKTSVDWTAGAGIGINATENTSIELNYTKISDKMDHLMLAAHIRF